MPLYTFDVPGMRGPCCVNKVKRATLKSPFHRYTPDIQLDKKTVLFDVKADDELNTHDKGKLQALFDEALSTEGLSCAQPHAKLGAIGLLTGFLVLLASVLVPGMPLALLGMLSFASAGLTLLLGEPFYRSAWHSLKEDEWTMDTLFALSTAVILVVSVAGFFFPGLPMMFDAGLLIFGFRHAGIAITDAFRKRANKKNAASTEDKLQKVMRYTDDGSLEEVLASMLKPGDKLSIAIGERLPVDGYFEAGAGRIFNGNQTGSYQSEALPRLTTLYEGTELLEVVDGKSLDFTVQKPLNASFMARLVQDVAQRNVARALNKEDPEPNTLVYWLKYFIRAVLGVAALSGLFVGLWFASPVLGIQVAVSVLVAACPCTLGLIAPLVMRFAMSILESLGFAIQKPEHIEKLPRLNAVLCDIHGLFTHGAPRVNLNQSYAVDDNVEQLLAKMAHLESVDHHRIARAIKQAAGERISDFEGGEVTRLASSYGELHVSMDGVDYMLGSRDMMAALGIPPAQLELSNMPTLGESVVYLASNGNIQGYLMLEDPIRDGAETMLQAFRDAGVHVYLCTGADDEVAARYARHLRTQTKIFSGCRPYGDKTKVAALKKLKTRYQNVGFLGDGLNDAEVLGACDFGLFLKHQHAYAGGQQGASVVLESESLKPVARLLHMAKKATEQVTQNVGFSVLYNMLAVLAPAGLMLGAGVAISPAVCAGLMMLQALLIFTNVYYQFECKDEPDTPGPSSSISSDFNTDITSGFNGMRLAHTDHKRLLQTKGELNGVSNTCCDSLNQVEVPTCH